MVGSTLLIKNHNFPFLVMISQEHYIYMPFLLLYPSVDAKIILYSSGIDACRVAGARIFLSSIDGYNVQTDASIGEKKLKHRFFYTLWLLMRAVPQYKLVLGFPWVTT